MVEIISVILILSLFGFLIFIIILPFLIGFIAAYSMYKKTDEKINSAVFLYGSAGLSLGACVSLILLLYFFREVYNQIISEIPDMNLLIAIFALSLAIIYGVDSVVSTDKNQNTILSELIDIKYNLKKNNDFKQEIKGESIVQNEGLNLPDQEKIDNFKGLMWISYERCNQLTTLNHQSTGITAAIAIGAITFLGSAYFTSKSSERFFAVPIAINLLICTLILWRYYSHVIDNDIAQGYKKILYCESALKINKKISLLTSIEGSLPILYKTGYAKENIENQYNILHKLIDSKKIGYRWHDFLDQLSMNIIALAILFESYFISINPDQFSIWTFALLVVLPISYLIFCLGLVKDIFPRIPIQRDPSCEDIQEIIKEIEGSNV